MVETLQRKYHGAVPIRGWTACGKEYEKISTISDELPEESADSYPSESNHQLAKTYGNYEHVFKAY